jgi:transcription elongation factor Elf1
MAWFVDENADCPNCKSTNAKAEHRDNLIESYYLICNKCGLHLYAEGKELIDGDLKGMDIYSWTIEKYIDSGWVVDKSYIDKSVIGKDNDLIEPSDDVYIENDKTFKDDGIIKPGTILMETYLIEELAYD